MPCFIKAWRGGQRYGAMARYTALYGRKHISSASGIGPFAARLLLGSQMPKAKACFDWLTLVLRDTLSLIEFDELARRLLGSRRRRQQT